MSFYIDTSVLVAIFTKEASAAYLVNSIQIEAKSTPSVSAWNVSEFAAATSFKYIQNLIDEELRESARLNFVKAQGTLFSVFPIETADFFRAANFANKFELRLRGGDALHLGIAAGRNLPILTLDNRMKAAAQTLGIGTVEID